MPCFYKITQHFAWHSQQDVNRGVSGESGLCPFSFWDGIGEGEGVGPGGGGGEAQQCPRGRRGDGKESVCAPLGACLVQAHCDYSRRLEIEKQLETDVLKELTGEGEQIWLLERRIKVKLSQLKKTALNNRIIHFWMVTADVDPGDCYGDIWGDSDEHISEGLGELEERSVWPLI